MEQARIKELKRISANIKLGALEAVFSASSGHPGDRSPSPTFSRISTLRR